MGLFVVPRALIGYAQARRRALRHAVNRETGASAIEWAIIAAIVVAAAVGLALIIATVVMDHGQDVQHQGR